MTFLLDLTDDSITACSELNTDLTAERVKLNNYCEQGAGAWCASLDDHRPWVQFDFERNVTVWGVYVRPRCDEPYTNERVTSLKVTKSDDGLEWCEASGVMSVTYPNIADGRGERAMLWFREKFATARYWSITVLDWEGHPCMKADLYGKSA